jgi:hypothetical protein
MMVETRWNKSMEKDHLSDAAKRALAEAELRRKTSKSLNMPKEYNGSEGHEPTRYGDWERKGIATDF